MSNMIATMDTVLDRPSTTESFLAWEDHQEGKHEFDRHQVLAMTGGSVAHQCIVMNLRIALACSPTGRSAPCMKCACAPAPAFAIPMLS